MISPAPNTAMTTPLHGWPGHGLSLLCGTLPTLSLAPFHLWPLGIVASTLLFALVHNQARRTIVWRSWLFGVGLFGSGTSWVYVSIQQHGDAPPLLAATLVLLFTLGLALLVAIMGLLYSIATRHHQQLSTRLGFIFASCWTLGEWLRCWFLTGFPWLFLGNAHLNTPLAGWAPIIGVLGLSFIVALSGASLYLALRLRGRRRWTLALLTLGLWLGGMGLQKATWVEPAGEPLRIALVQPNIAQAVKWQPEAFNEIMDTYQTLSAETWNADLVIWPEAAIPRLYQYIPKQLAQLSLLAQQNSSTLVTGIPYRVNDTSTELATYYNSVVALGSGSGVYFKQRLVPFGEYVPLERWLRGIIDFFDLPMSHMSWGPKNQDTLQAGPWQLASFVCYEVVYPDMVARDSNTAHFIVNVSNDSWFGHSIGPLQHFQIARMRALENGRYLLRGTNNGVTAIIDHQARIVQRADQFTRTVIRGEAVPMQGRTPFNRLGSAPIVSLCLLIIAATMLGATSRYRSATAHAV